MCQYDDSFLESQDFTKTILHPLVIAEVPMHLLGGYILIFKTPAKMSSIKWSMFALHAWSSLLDIHITSITTPVFYFPFTAGRIIGLVSILDVYKPLRLYMMTAILAGTVTSIVGLFENRYNALKFQNKISDNWQMVHLLLNYLMAFTFMVPSLLIVPDQAMAIASVRKQLPCVPSKVFDDPEFFVMSMDTRLMTYSTAALSVIFCTQIFFFFFRILRFLSNKENVSENTYKIQRKFYAALSIQLAIPLIFLLTPVLYMIFAFMAGYFNQILNNLLFVMVALHGLVSTCVMLSVHAPYRESVRKLICFWRKDKHCPTKRMSIVVSL